MIQPQQSPHSQNFINGVNVTGILETIDAIKQDKDLARFQFRADNRWVNGGHNRSTIQGFSACGSEDTSRHDPFVLDADEPPILFGKDHGANPVEFVLHGLISCLTTTMVYHAAAQGIEIGAVDSHIEGDLDLRGFLGLSEDVRKGYETIRVNMKVKSEASPKTLEKLAKFSPVYDIVSKSLPVEVVIETY